MYAPFGALHRCVHLYLPTARLLRLVPSLGPSDPEMQKRLEDDLIWWPRRLTLELSVAASPVDHQRLYQSILLLHQSFAR